MSAITEEPTPSTAEKIVEPETLPEKTTVSEDTTAVSEETAAVLSATTEVKTLIALDFFPPHIFC